MKTQTNKAYQVITAMAMVLMFAMSITVPTTTWAVSNPDLEKAVKACSKKYNSCQSDCKASAATPPKELACIDSQCKKAYNECRTKAESQYK